MSLIVALLLLPFASGRWAIPIAAWLAPVFLLSFVRGGSAVPRLFVAALALYASACFSWQGMVPVPPALYFPIMAMIALPGLIPYVLDRVIARRLDGFEATLVFPTAWVLTEYLVARVSPYGSWGSVAYTQVDNLPLVQLASIGGLWGIAFLVAWLAPVLAYVWERRTRWIDAAAVALIYAGVLAVALIGGGARMTLSPPAGATLRVASVTIPPPQSPWDLLENSRVGASLESLRDSLHEHQDSLFAALRREAHAGARLVFWSEVNAFVLHDEAEAFLERAAGFARRERVHLVVAFAEFTPGQGFYENQLAAFDSTGTQLARYHKARPVPGDPERGKDREIPVFATALGRVAGVICFDGDFPDLVRKSGRERADLMIVPASDWREIDPLHTRMALMRGVENGCSVVRQTNKGLSAAADYQGRIVAAVDFFRTTPNVMVAQVPVRGTRTFYARFPELAPLACAALMAFLVMAAMGRGRRLAR